MARLLTLIFLSIFAYSCTTKKVITATGITKEKIDSTYIEKKDSTSFIQRGVSVTEKLFEIQIDPIDVSKPIIIDGVKYENASLKIKKADKFITDTTKNIVSVVVDKEVQLEKESTIKDYSKDVDRKPNFLIWVWLFIILVVIFGAIRLASKFLL